MEPRQYRADGGDARGRGTETGAGAETEDTTRPDRRRAVAGGVAVLVAFFGFTAARATVDATGLSDESVLVALPVFGVVGVVGFVLLVSAVVGE